MDGSPNEHKPTITSTICSFTSFAFPGCVPWDVRRCEYFYSIWIANGAGSYEFADADFENFEDDLDFIAWFDLSITLGLREKNTEF